MTTEEPLQLSRIIHLHPHRNHPSPTIAQRLTSYHGYDQHPAGSREETKVRRPSETINDVEANYHAQTWYQALLQDHVLKDLGPSIFEGIQHPF